MEKKWIVAEEPPLEPVAQLASELDIPHLIAKILILRNITTATEAKYFLEPEISDLTDPFIFPDMEKAVNRIIIAIKKKEHIMIHGDYDVDGITSTSMLFLALRKFGANVSYFIPNRLNSGYGLSEASIEEAVRRGCKVLVTVDCGITAIEETLLAQKVGIETIITDHHEFQDNPISYAVINPKILPSDNPVYCLAGVGVAFKLVQALYYAAGYSNDDLIQYLDFVAMGSVADLVPLIGENRILARFGIEQLADGNNPGFQALLEVSGLTGRTMTSGRLVFNLAPRINAVGRLGDAQLAVRLFTVSNHQQALNIARILEEKNKRRRRIDEETFNEARSIVEESVNLDKTSSIILASENWHQGVIGIVASRIVERFHRPTIMISIDSEKGIGKGSARSVEGFHLFDAMKKCEKYLVAFGGHQYAAGLTILPNRVDDFRQAFQQVAKDEISAESFIPKLKIDCEISLDMIGDELVKHFHHLAPFGPDNMRPVFISRSLELVGTPSIVGQNHLKFKVKKNESIFEAIAYKMGDKFYDRLQFERPRINLAYVLDENDWMGKKTVQLRVKGIKFNDDI